MLKLNLILLTILILFNIKFLNSCRTSSVSNKKSCGISKDVPILSKIIGGDDVYSIYSWPWMVSILVREDNSLIHHCGGVLVNSRYVLTAASCVSSLSTYNLFVLHGTKSLSTATDLDIAGVDYIFKYPYFETDKSQDLALLRLNSKIMLFSWVSPICLPSSKDYTKVFNQTLLTAGWGTTTPSAQSYPNRLIQTQLKIVNNQSLEICKGLDNSYYCAMSTKIPVSNICYGDFGGPLMYYENNIWVLYGIASQVTVNTFNNYCLPNSPSYFTIIPNHIDWINNIIGPYE